MNVLQYNNTKTLFFVSGMFGGSWIWDETHEKIPNTQNFLIEDPLCSIGNRITSISESIVDELKKLSSPVYLVGNSLGSLISLYTATLAPEKVQGVIISGSAGFGEVNLNFRLSPHNSYEIADYLVELICHNKDKATHQVKEKTAESFKANTRNIARLMKESNLSKAEDIIAKVQCPIYAIWGANDVITPISSAESTFEKFGIPVRLINECGHSPMYEKPDEFAQLVRDCIH
jgi:pimeloyl-ACP methyl ester carboxylesterase